MKPILIIFIFLITTYRCNQRFYAKSDTNVELFKKFALNYQSNENAKRIQLIPCPTKKINDYLLRIDRGSLEFESVKEYAFLILMKVLLVRTNELSTSILLESECTDRENCVEVICLKEFGLKKYNLENVESYQITLGTFYTFINKKEIHLEELKIVLDKLTVRYLTPPK